ncbi:hypothetical protein AgCh_033807 [Apium graveolens]
MDKLAFWNVRGFNNPIKRKEVTNLIINNQVGLCALIETHVAKGRVKNVFDRMFRNWDWFSNSVYCRRGCRIVVGWNPVLFDVVEIISTDQVIHCVVTELESRISFHCSVVYAANEHVDRREVWQSLRSYSMLTSSSPWIVMGDFNAMLNSSEMQGGVDSRSPAIQEFRDCVNFIEVQDIVYSGIQFTWAGSPHGVGVVKKLDRVMANLNFLNKFAGASVNFLPRGVSDHSPAVVNLNLIRRKGKSSFKFNNFLAYRENFPELVSGCWKQRVGGVKMYQVTQKLHRLKRIFKSESWKGGDLSQNCEILKARLVDIQIQLDSAPFDEELRIREQAVAREYRSCKLEEERLLKQRAKVHWLKVGDQNSKFFHKSLQARRFKKTILEISDEEGNVLQGEGMVSHFVDYYRNLLGKKDYCDRCVGLDSFAKRLDYAAANDLVREVSSEEIKEVIFHMGDDKASGPDGYSALFFKKAWVIIGEDVCQAVKEFFVSGKLLKEVNATLIALIPKIEHPTGVGDFRPIALCNVIYKCITKLIANRIKGCLNELVDDTQNAFIPGRRISDNILLTQELLKNYHRNVGRPRCAIKVDIKKAYDSVSWDFLIDALQLFGFPERMIGWIRECISSPSYSVILNGQMHGYFKGEKGLRQGDPLSPYLFTLVMQMLSLMIKRRVEEEGNFNYHPKCAKFNITHLSFADDLFLFCAATPTSVQILKDCMDEFGRCSGLWPNNGKSEVFFGNVPRDVKLLIQNILDFNVGSLPVKYLGVPLISTTLWVNDCKALIQKVRDKIDSWENNWLNYAGRVQLASSVLLSLQVYWGSIFLLPISVTKQVEKLIRGFIWGGKDSAKGKAKVAWKDVCCPKQEGGLGLRRRNFWDITEAWDAPWSWKNILALRTEVRPFIKTHVGNGQKTSFWFDTWALDVPFSSICSHRDISGMGLNKYNTVADFGVDGQVVWPQELVHKIPELQGISVRLSNSLDQVKWFSREGCVRNFSVSQVWKDLRPHRSIVSWWHLVWFPKSIPKHCFTLWLAIRQRLLTQDRLQSWQVQQRVVCSFCERVQDSVEHLFFDCGFCRMVLVEFQRRGVVFHLWQERNRRLFQTKRKQVWQVVSDVEDDVRKKLQDIEVLDLMSRSAGSFEVKVRNRVFVFGSFFAETLIGVGWFCSNEKLWFLFAWGFGQISSCHSWVPLFGSEIWVLGLGFVGLKVGVVVWRGFGEGVRGLLNWVGLFEVFGELGRSFRGLLEVQEGWIFGWGCLRELELGEGEVSIVKMELGRSAGGRCCPCDAVDFGHLRLLGFLANLYLRPILCASVLLHNLRVYSGSCRRVLFSSLIFCMDENFLFLGFCYVFGEAQKFFDLHALGWASVL